MTENKYPLTKKEFNEIYAKVPRLTVEIILKNKKNELYLTKRAIEPCKGQWHLPGGTVYYGEPLIEAVARVAAKELDINVHTANQVGIIEYPSHYTNKLGSPVGIVFEVKSYSGEIKLSDEAADGNWWMQLPSPMHGDQDDYLLKHNYLKQ